MKRNKFTSMLLCVVAGSMGLLSCENSDDPNAIAYAPGENLFISGVSEAYVGDVEEYGLVMNIKDLDYTWSIGSGASISENSENDAYVDVSFSSPGDYTLSVANGGGAEGTMGISVMSRMVGINSAATSVDTLMISETSMSDTVTIDLNIGGGFNGDFTVDYSIVADDDTDFSVVAGYESPYTVSDADEAMIKLVVSPDDEVETAEYITFVINSITPAMADEYVLADDGTADYQDSVRFAIMDDLKMVSINTDTMTVEEAGVYEFPVMLSSASQNEVKVYYTVSAAAGVTDATPSNVMGELVFDAGETSKNIVLSMADLAFDSDDMVTIDILSVIGDNETTVDADMDSKVIMIEDGVE